MNSSLSHVMMHLLYDPIPAMIPCHIVKKKKQSYPYISRCILFEKILHAIEYLAAKCIYICMSSHVHGST